MRIVSSVPAMQKLALAWQGEAVRVSLVPTMGCLHDGHLSLVRRGRGLVGGAGKVVVSIYVNPTQFGPAEDFSRYPRNLVADAAACRDAGVDIVFAPGDGQMYPADGSGAFSTYVVENSLAAGMEGASRPTHFRGVTTVVAKLFNIVRPTFAVFGAKDYQQAAIVRRMVRDLNFPVRILVAPTHREKDGLAMSSRNRYLDGGLRGQALALSDSLHHARTAVRQSRSPLRASRLRAELKRRIESHPSARVDYIEFFDPETLIPASMVSRGDHLALAVFIGKTRLIDNARL